MPSDFDPKKAYEALQKVGPGREERVDAPMYAPPPGRPNYDIGLGRFRYVPDPISEDGLQLERFEQKYIYRAALQISSVFGPEVQPIPDSMYSSLPHAHKASQLFVVVSRTSLKRIDSSKIAWPAILVVVKEIPIVKIICIADFAADTFEAWQIIFWRDDIGNYERPITRGHAPIPVPMVVEFVARYATMKGIR